MNANKSGQKNNQKTAQHLATKELATEILNLVPDSRQLAWRSLRAGIFQGIGFTLGTILVLVTVSALVTMIGGWPFIGEFLVNIQNYLKK